MITLYAIEQLSPDELKTIGKEAVKRMETAAESLSCLLYTSPSPRDRG